MATGVETPPEALVRIGELSRRVGVRPETLRAWERRYELLNPGRSEGGYRLYSSADEARVRAMTELIAQGLSAAEAAKFARDAPMVARRTGVDATEAGRAPRATGVALAEPLASATAGAGASASAPAGPPATERARRELLEALAGFDERRANAVLDAAFASFGLADVLADVLLALLVDVGDLWEAKRLSVGQEHFCSELLRGRMLAIARGWGAGDGPLALLACPPGEHHDLGLVAFGLLIHQRGWRVAFLGPDTPVDTLDSAADLLRPEAVVVSTVDGERLRESEGALRGLAGRHRLLVGGSGADEASARSLGARLLDQDPVAAAGLLAASAAPG
ncbi:MAG: MerR family transcriptional regulator [Solirubrobacterales bacterium]